MSLVDNWIPKQNFVDVILADDINAIADQAIQNELAIRTLEGGGGGGSGFSPTIEVTSITGGHRITITDVNGTKSVDVMDGYTPQKNVDYFTEADKQELVNDVLSALPTWTGGNY